MAADLEKLVPELKAKVRQLIEHCRARGIEMRANNGLRDPFEQARLWRQSRSSEEIEAKIRDLEAKDAPFLAHCIRSVGPQHGEHVTDTPPGISWHQWGEALDCFWLVNGKAEWSTKKLVDGLNGYHVYAHEAETLGLTAGGHWKKFKDWPHVQLRKANNAARVMSLAAINSAMNARFGGSHV
jgi:peptidoglycan LD-endopeptidase CwlK